MCNEYEDFEESDSDSDRQSEEWNGNQCQQCGSVVNVVDVGGGEDLCEDCFMSRFD